MTYVVIINRYSVVCGREQFSSYFNIVEENFNTILNNFSYCDGNHGNTLEAVIHIQNFTVPLTTPSPAMAIQPNYWGAGNFETVVKNPPPFSQSIQETPPKSFLDRFREHSSQFSLWTVNNIERRIWRLLYHTVYRWSGRPTWVSRQRFDYLYTFRQRVWINITVWVPWAILSGGEIQYDGV